MSRYVYEAYTRVAWVPTISSIAAPTTSELNAGTDLSTLVTKDGLTTPQNQNNVDSATLAETFDAQLAGSWGGACELTCFRDNEDDAAWDLFDYGTNGYLVIRRGVTYDTAWTNGQKVEVYPVQCHQPIMQPTAANEQQRFNVSLPVTRQPDLKATVGGGS